MGRLVGDGTGRLVNPIPVDDSGLISPAEYRNRVLKKLFFHPVIVIGLTVGLVMLFLSLRGGNFWFRAIAGVVTTAGAIQLVYQLVFKFNEVARSVFTNMHQSVEQNRRRRLDGLDARLSADNEPRDEQALRSLRALYRVFLDHVKEGRIREYDFLSTSERLFNTCIRNLETSLERRQMARGLPEKTQTLLLSESDQLITEVEKSVDSLTDAFNKIHQLTCYKGKELALIRDELTRRVEIFEQVEEGLQAQKELDELNQAKQAV